MAFIVLVVSSASISGCDDDNNGGDDDGDSSSSNPGNNAGVMMQGLGNLTPNGPGGMDSPPGHSVPPGPGGMLLPLGGQHGSRSAGPHRHAISLAHTGDVGLDYVIDLLNANYQETLSTDQRSKFAPLARDSAECQASISNAIGIITEETHFQDMVKTDFGRTVITSWKADPILAGTYPTSLCDEIRKIKLN